MKSFADGLKGFVDGNLTLINFVIAVCSLVSYEVTMYLIVYWTHWTDNAGAYGGVLDYRFLGISTIFHVTGQNVQAQALFAFPDITSYLLIILIILNSALLRRGWKAEASKFGKLEGLYTSLILGFMCIFAYVWGTMIPVANSLKSSNNTPGGVLEYRFPWAYSVYHVTSGQLESMGVGFGFDFSAWLLLIIITLNLIATASVRWSTRQD